MLYQKQHGIWTDKVCRLRELRDRRPYLARDIVGLRLAGPPQPGKKWDGSYGVEVLKNAPNDIALPSSS